MVKCSGCGSGTAVGDCNGKDAASVSMVGFADEAETLERLQITSSVEDTTCSCSGSPVVADQYHKRHPPEVKVSLPGHWRVGLQQY